MDIGPRIRGPGDRRADDVADAEDERPGLAGQFDGGQRVGRLARLRHGHDDVVLADDGVAVAELRGVLHLDGNAADRLHEVFADQRGVPRRAARHENDAPGVHEPVAVVDHARKFHLAGVGVDASADAVDDGPGLLVNLLEHEMGIAALFQLRDRQLEFLDVDLRVVVVQRDDFQRGVAVDHGDFAVAHVDEILGVFDDRRGVGREEELPVAHAHDHRAALPRGDDPVVVALLDDGDGVGADHLPEGLPHGFGQRAAAGRPDVFDQIHQHLGVGAAAEGVSVLFEGVLQHAVVLDDAVVYQGYVLRFGVVGMGVGVVRNPVRGPAGVGDADIAAEVLSVEEMLQIGDLALAFEYVETPVRVDQRDARTVVSPVFEAVKPLYQNRARVAPPDISDYSAHVVLLFCPGQK